MNGLVPGRIVLFVFDIASAEAAMRRRTDGQSILERMQASPPAWPAGAQAHVGNPITAGDVAPAMVVAVNSATNVNLKVFLDGTDVYWATSVGFDEGLKDANDVQAAILYRPYSFHWMFSGQGERYTPNADVVEKLVATLVDAAVQKAKPDLPTEEEIRTWLKAEVSQQVMLAMPSAEERAADLAAAVRTVVPTDIKSEIEAMKSLAQSVQAKHGDSAAYVQVQGDLRRLLDKLA